MYKINQFLDYIKNNYNLNKIVIALVVLLCAVLFFIYSTQGNDEIVIENDYTSDGINQESKEEEGGNSQLSNDETSDGTIYIDISGEVKKPGVYELNEGCRIFQVIDKAGGLKKNADIEIINQAQIVMDGEKIIIPKKGKVSEKNLIERKEEDNGMININTADIDELDEIPGIGPVTADGIITYRESSGRFKTIEEIKNVNGIGEKTFDKIKKHICV